MLFSDALGMLEEGAQVVRECWKSEDGYLVLLPGMKHIWKILPYPNPNAGNHILSVEELKASDWELYDGGESIQKVGDNSGVL